MFGTHNVSLMYLEHECVSKECLKRLQGGVEYIEYPASYHEGFENDENDIKRGTENHHNNKSSLVNLDDIDHQ